MLVNQRCWASICVIVTVHGDTLPSACILMFQFLRDVSGLGVGTFPPANESTQVWLGVDKTQQLDAIQTEKIAHADVAVKTRKYSPSEAKQQMDKARSRDRVNMVWFSATFEH